MTTTEDRLTAALTARADQVRPEDLTYASPSAGPSGSRSVAGRALTLSRVPRAAAFALAAAAAVAAIAVPFVVAGPAQPPRLEPAPQPGVESPLPSHVRHEPKTPSMEVEVFYGREGTDSLVARRVQIPERGDPIARALELAAEEPAGAGVTAVVPADAISQVGFDGIGRNGTFSLTLSDRSWTEMPAEMTVAEARLAQRAVLCTVQSFGAVHGGHQPIHLYLRSGTPAGDRLFGVPLPPTTDHAMNVVGCS